MFIIRNNKKIILTPDELEAAYREQKHNYQLENARSQFEDFLNYEHNEALVAKCGYTCNDVCDPDSAYYLLEKFVAAYDKQHDCNNAENDMWQEVIRTVLFENALNVRITYDANLELWDLNVPDGTSWRRVTTLYPSGFTSVEELRAAIPIRAAVTFERAGVRNGKVLVRMTLKRVKNIGNDGDLRDWTFMGPLKDIHATMVDGKLVFDAADGKEG